MSNARKMKFINYISKMLVEYLRDKFHFLGEFTIDIFPSHSPPFGIAEFTESAALSGT